MLAWSIGVLAPAVQIMDVSGHYQPLPQTPGPGLAIASDRVTFDNGIVLETAVETSGAVQVSVMSAQPSGGEEAGSAPPSKPPDEYVEQRRIVRSQGNARSLCSGRAPTHVLIYALGDRIGVGLLRRTLFGYTSCGVILYQRG